MNNNRGQIPARGRRAQGNANRTWMFLGGALAVLATGACNNESLPVAPPLAKAATIIVVSGNGQAGVVGSPAAKPLGVEIKDQRGMLMPGAMVTFWTNGDGSLSALNVVSDSSGVASVVFTFGVAEGATKVFAVADGVADTLTFSLQADPGPPIALDELVDSTEVAAAGATLLTPLVVELVDFYGNPIAGATVTWSVDGGGVLSSPTSVTDANGKAQVTLTLPSTVGPETVRAHVDNVTDAVFTVIAQ